MSNYSKEYLNEVLHDLPPKFTPRDLQTQINVSQKKARSILRHAASYDMVVDLRFRDRWKKIDP